MKMSAPSHASSNSESSSLQTPPELASLLKSIHGPNRTAALKSRSRSSTNGGDTNTTTTTTSTAGNNTPIITANDDDDGRRRSKAHVLSDSTNGPFKSSRKVHSKSLNHKEVYEQHKESSYFATTLSATPTDSSTTPITTTMTPHSKPKLMVMAPMNDTSSITALPFHLNSATITTSSSQRKTPKIQNLGHPTTISSSSKTNRGCATSTSTISIPKHHPKSNDRIIPKYRKVLDIYEDHAPKMKLDAPEHHLPPPLPSSSPSSSMDISSPREGELSEDYYHRPIKDMTTTTITTEMNKSQTTQQPWNSPLLLKSSSWKKDQPSHPVLHDDRTKEDNRHGLDILQSCIDSRGQPHITKGVLKRVVHGPPDDEHVLKKLLMSCGGGDKRGIFTQNSLKGWNNSRNTEIFTYPHSKSTVSPSMLVELKRTSSIDSVESSVTQGTLNEEEKKYTLALLKKTKVVLEEEEVISECKDTGMILLHQELPSGWVVGFSVEKNMPLYTHPDHGRSFHMPVVQSKSIKVFDRNGSLCITFTRDPLSNQLKSSGKTIEDMEEIGTLAHVATRHCSTHDSTSEKDFLGSNRKNSTETEMHLVEQRAGHHMVSSESIHYSPYSSVEDIDSDVTADILPASQTSSISVEKNYASSSKTDSASNWNTPTSPNSVMVGTEDSFGIQDEYDDRSSEDSINSFHQSYQSKSYTRSSADKCSIRSSTLESSYCFQSLENDDDIEVTTKPHHGRQQSKASESNISAISISKIQHSLSSGCRISDALANRLSKIYHPICSLQRLDAIAEEARKEWKSRHSIRCKR